MSNLFEHNNLHVKSSDNYSDTWLTPPEILHPLGKFDLDPCAAKNMPWKTADNMLTIDDDGLSSDWFGRVFMNPPYSDVENWMEKMASHNNGIVLIFARTDTQYFHRYVFPKATGILFIEGRLSFYKESGMKAKSNGGAPSVLISYNEENYNVLDKCGIRGKLLEIF